jgi:hypothetical protein
VSERGNWVGNRGVLINDRREVVRPFRLQRWITCSLQFKDRHREVFTPRRWTELFFLDEATAMSAGHRPCAECRRERYNAYKSAWLASVKNRSNISAVEMDSILNSDRLLPNAEKRTFPAKLSSLPPGTFFEYENAAILIWNDQLWRWSFSGYVPARPLGPPTLVEVLTPSSTLNVLSEGYIPQVHESANLIR